MMELCVPTNWDDRLLERIRNRDGGRRITEIYGKLPFDAVGGGRSAFALAFISRGHARRHIRTVRGLGIRFNYLLNAMCLDNSEFTRAGQKRISTLLDWIVSSGADKVTVSNPYLFMWIRRRYPQLGVCVSTISGVDTVSRAKFWESLGADMITLHNSAVNRDLNLIRQMRKALACRIQVIATNSCLLDCPFSEFHNLSTGHASQTWHRCGSYFFDHYVLRCRFLRIADPVRFIRSDWIRPEDSQIYEDLGIDSLKLTDRQLSTPALMKIVEAYLDRSYEGDLLELFSTLRGFSCLDHRGVLRKILALITQLPGALAARRFMDCFEKLKVRIDNRALDGFVAGLPAGCTGRDCRDCGYCRAAAQRAVKIDEQYRVSACKRFEDVLAELSTRGLNGR